MVKNVQSGGSDRLLLQRHHQWPFFCAAVVLVAVGNLQQPAWRIKDAVKAR